MHIVDVLMDTEATGPALAEQLEHGNVVHYSKSPFPLPAGDDLDVLLHQSLGSHRHKNVSYNPLNGEVRGIGRCSPAKRERLAQAFQRFSDTVTDWLGGALALYQPHWRLDLVSYRPVEESTRQLRTTARNDLIHVDSFPNRPCHGSRILRVFANLNPSLDRVWVVSEPFGQLLRKHQNDVGLPTRGETSTWERTLKLVDKALHPMRPARSVHDRFMKRMHHYLKRNEAFQKHCRKRIVRFPPGSVWLAMTDAVSHAVLRGHCAMDHSYFIDLQSLVAPESAPARLLETACGKPVFPRAA